MNTNAEYTPRAMLSSFGKFLTRICIYKLNRNHKQDKQKNDQSNIGKWKPPEAVAEVFYIFNKQVLNGIR